MALASNEWLDDEVDVVADQAVYKLAPYTQFQYDSAARYGQAMGLDRMKVRGDPPAFAKCRVELANQMMAVKVKFERISLGTALDCAKRRTVKAPRLAQISRLNNYMERMLHSVCGAAEWIN